MIMPASAQALKVAMVANPSGAASLQAHWSGAADGSGLLSWLMRM
jgi:ABC-type nitrate/sulfonate/bicarbonate transport system substrate-binding protein